MTDLSPDHPLLLQGRRHARDVIASAERIGRLAGDPERASVLSTAAQLVLSAAMVDGEDPQDVYAALINTLVWAVCRLPKDDRLGVLGAVVKEAVEKIEAHVEVGEVVN